MVNKYEKIFGRGWFVFFEPFLQSEDFLKIGRKLKQDHEAGLKIYPVFDDVFRAFKECPYNDLHTVMLTNNAYTKGEGDGLAFSSKMAVGPNDAPPMLRKIFDALEQDVANGLYLDRNPDLVRWANQGVLLLNLDLTTESGKPGSHLELWRPFMEYLITILSAYVPGIAYCFFGKEAKKYLDRVDILRDTTYVIEHPQSAVVLNRPWRHKNIFSDISTANKFINGKEMQWL